MVKNEVRCAGGNYVSDVTEPRSTGARQEVPAKFNNTCVLGYASHNNIT